MLGVVSFAIWKQFTVIVWVNRDCDVPSTLSRRITSLIIFKCLFQLLFDAFLVALHVKVLEQYTNLKECQEPSDFCETLDNCVRVTLVDESNGLSI